MGRQSIDGWARSVSSRLLSRSSFSTTTTLLSAPCGLPQYLLSRRFSFWVSTAVQFASIHFKGFNGWIEDKNDQLPVKENGVLTLGGERFDPGQLHHAGCRNRYYFERVLYTASRIDNEEKRVSC